MSKIDWAVAKNQRPYARGDGAGDMDEAESRLYKLYRHFWHPVAYVHELDAHQSQNESEGRPLRVTLCGQDLVLARLNGKVCAFNDVCPHRGTALSLGSICQGRTGDELRCAYHGWQFSDTGHCSGAPQMPDLDGQLRARVRQYRCEERYGMVWVSLADQPYYPIPQFPQWSDPAYQKIFVPSDEWNCTAMRRTENYTDLGHFAIVHDGFLGDRTHPRPPAHECWREGAALRMQALEPKLEPGMAKYGLPPSPGSNGLVETSQNWWIYLPLTVTFLQAAPGDRHWVLFFHPTPIGPTRIRNMTIAARNFGDRDAATAEQTIAFTQMVYEQDRAIVESQRPGQISEDLSEEMFLKGVDTLSAHYRRTLLELARELVPA